jgi:hypothetical protein
MHTYENSGIYDVTMEIESAGRIYTRTKNNYIIVHGDTIGCNDAIGQPGKDLGVDIMANNIIPVKVFWLPVEYAGDLNLTLDSVSTNGCRTDGYSIYQVTHDKTNKRAYYRIYNDIGGLQYLMPGEGPILRLYFSIPDGVSPGQTNPLIVDGYPERTPIFETRDFQFTPRDKMGTISIFLCGDADGEGMINILDVVYLINYLYKNGAEPVMPEFVDVNGDTFINILDIVYVINFLYKGGEEPICYVSGGPAY